MLAVATTDSVSISLIFALFPPDRSDSDRVTGDAQNCFSNTLFFKSQVESRNLDKMAIELVQNCLCIYRSCEIIIFL